MPTPLDLILSPVSWAVFAIYVALIVAEALFPGRPFPRVRGWRAMAFAAFVAYFFISAYLPMFWDASLAQYRLFDLTAQPVWLQYVAGLLVYELGAYWWHRSMHRFTPLWRAVHQMHHSSERLDAASAYWFSPADMAGWTLLASVSLVLVVGLAAWPATLVMLTVTFLAVFQHTNIRTPRWLGLVVQRPEAHSHHHARGVHWNNFADLPVFDMVFGTYRNPRRFADATGFYDGASYRVPEMIAMVDVSKPKEAKSPPEPTRFVPSSAPRGA